MAKTKPVIILHFGLFLFSLGPVFAKLAGKYEFLSNGFFFFYGLMLCIIGVYAILWQQVLRKISLITAFSNKAIIVLWGMLWGYLFFQESITLAKVIGACLVCVGIIIMVKADE